MPYGFKCKDSFYSDLYFIYFLKASTSLFPCLLHSIVTLWMSVLKVDQRSAIALNVPQVPITRSDFEGDGNCLLTRCGFIQLRGKELNTTDKKK